MVDFKKFVKKERIVDPTNLIGLFNALDRRATHIELRPSQDQALQQLMERRSEKDLILKISTGTGKTAVGLLYLYSHMIQAEAPAVYLCPTVQLVEQVIEEADKLGIKAFPYPANEVHPNAEAVAGKALIVCSYAKLFNAKSTFDRSDVLLRPTAIVLDDAHAGIEEIRNKFTLTILEPPLVRELTDLLSDSCRAFRPGTWQDIVAGDSFLSLEVPYWLWKPLLPEVLKKLSPHAEDESFKFVWPFIRDVLRWCRCIVTSYGIEIIPEILPVHKCEAYSKANHRLFMSATLADDSVLIREIGCGIEAARIPIVPKTDHGLGERMVVAPSLIDKSLDRTYVMRLSALLSKHRNVVVLTPSEALARQWETVGAQVVLGEGVANAIRDLRNPKSGLRFVVFVQRYDGVDLPDSACRVLVMDGLPFGESITDKYDASLSSTPGGMRNRIIYRMEQGMGRAVRSHVDYAVIILAGADLANFIAKKEVLKSMNPGTRAQLNLAMDLAKVAREESPQNPRKALLSMIIQCLNRDEDWKQYYEENVRAVEPSQGTTEDARLVLASAEREAFQFAISNNPHEAVNTLRTALDTIEIDDKDKGWYLQRIANYMLDANPGQYLEIQQAAHKKNDALFCPPGVSVRPLSFPHGETQAKVLEWFKQFENPNGAIAAIQDLRARLSYDSSSETLEQALLELASLFGASGSRPEKQYGKGPDVLWQWPSVSLVIEAKNGNRVSLHKRDAGQLHQSLQWFRENYKPRPAPQPIIVAKVNLADNDAEFPPETKVILPEKMVNLLNNLERFYQATINGLPSSLDRSNLSQQLPLFSLDASQFLGQYTVRLSIKK